MAGWIKRHLEDGEQIPAVRQRSDAGEKHADGFITSIAAGLQQQHALLLQDSISLQDCNVKQDCNSNKFYCRRTATATCPGAKCFDRAQ
jgi:hypothetical protein